MKKICVIGKGSIGRRHFKIFKKMGYEVFFARRKKTKIDKDHNELSILSNKIYNFDKYVITNPSSLHFQTLEKIAKENAKILIEKPIITKISDLNKIIKIYKKKKLCLFSGYMMRFHPWIKKLKKKIKNDRIFYSRIIWQTYMPSWHKSENFKLSYASQKKLGGGVLFTCIHEIDLAIYLFGKVKYVYCEENIKNLKINVETSINLIITHKNGVNSNIILDFANPHESSRNIEIYSKKNFFKLDFLKKTFKEKKKGKFKKSTFTKIKIDDLYFKQNKEFIDVTKNKKFYVPDDFLLAEQVVFAAQKSLKNNCRIKI